ncbi:MAG: IclR family transcriptional regulator [Deltaproteobacteria bacterium]|nr:IclR family transcriptional regulator [Deltaproteobacteria bacterium]
MPRGPGFYDMARDDKKVNSIDKALTILSCFAPYNQEMGTSEISHKLGLHKATVSRILLNLARHNFLHQDPHTRKFSLGPSILQLARAINQSLDNNLIHIAKPFVDELRDELEETIVLEVLSGKNTIIAYLAEGPRPVRLAGTVGDVLPLHVAAGAKAILAFLPPERQKKLLDEDLARFTPNTITDKAVLFEQLREVREHGFAVDREEHDIGINAIGAPIFNSEKRAIASIVVAGPSQRITWSKDSSMVTLLKDTAAKISGRLFYA